MDKTNEIVNERTKKTQTHTKNMMEYIVNEIVKEK